MSATVAFGYTPQPDSLRQLLIGHGKACGITACIRDLAQLIQESKCLEHRSVDADADGRVSLLDALESWAAGKGAFGHDAGG